MTTPWLSDAARASGDARPPKWPELMPEVTYEFQVSPNRQCDWNYEGLGRFKTAALDAGFDSRFNPRITVSRRGLTARVVGTLTDEFIAQHGSSLDKVRLKFPWITPVRQTAVHTAVAEDAHLPARKRQPRGEIVATEVITLPPNSVMVIYPVAMANRARGHNTLAGNWLITEKVVAKSDNHIGRFGSFPFLLYTGSNGHALHGPITANELAWELKRGEVSHGCNRMEGEHVLEVAVLLGCTTTRTRRTCPRPQPGVLDDILVTVTEEFDHVPDPAVSVPEGPVSSWDEITRRWIVLDVDYPREHAVPSAWVVQLGDFTSFQLSATRVEGRSALADKASPYVRVVQFPTWDNRDEQLVSSANCR
jgi:hypothetical protein